MKALDPKDRPKLIALILIAFAAFGYSGFQFVSYNMAQAEMIAKNQAEAAKKAAATGPAAGTVPGAPALAATPGTAPTATTGATPAAAVTTLDTTTMSAALASLGPAALMPPTGGKDPFVQVGRYAENQARANRPPAPPTPATPTTPLPLLASKGGKSTFDPNSIFKETTGTAIGQPLPKPLIMLPPAPPPYVVVGVVVADRDMPGMRSIAVLRSNSAANPANGVTPSPAAANGPSATAERRFVGVGDPVGNGFVVAAIRASGVALRNGKQLITLQLGTNPGNVK